MRPRWVTPGRGAARITAAARVDDGAGAAAGMGGGEPAGVPLLAVLAGLCLGPGQAPERAVQRAGRHVPVPLGVPEDPQPLRRFGLELPQLPLEFLDLPLQGLVPAARAGDLA